MLSIRPANASDVPILKTLIHEFARFERLPASATEENLSADGFGKSPKFRVLIAEWDGEPAGYALLAVVASAAAQQNCFGVRWQVLDWNTPAIEFYKNLGATFLNDWKTISLEGDALARLAASSQCSQAQ
jgi:hypothetical protein